MLPIDFSRAELKWALDLIERVGKEGHMAALALADTFGVLSPHAMKYFVTEVQKRITKRLKAAIESGKTDFDIAEIGRDNICAFGQWLRGPTIIIEMRNSVEFIAAVQLHAHFHRCAARVLQYVADGNQARANAMMANMARFPRNSSLRWWNGKNQLGRSPVGTRLIFLRLHNITTTPIA